MKLVLSEREYITLEKPLPCSRQFYEIKLNSFLNKTFRRHYKKLKTNDFNLNEASLFIVSITSVSYNSVKGFLLTNFTLIQPSGIFFNARGKANA